MTTINRTTVDVLNTALDEGKTIFVGTAYRTTKITAKVRASFLEAGIEIFRERNGLEMASGRKFVDITFCNISVR